MELNMDNKAKQIQMIFPGKSNIGELRADGHIHWSDGGVWFPIEGFEDGDSVVVKADVTCGDTLLKQGWQGKVYGLVDQFGLTLAS